MTMEELNEKEIAIHRQIFQLQKELEKHRKLYESANPQ